MRSISVPIVTSSPIRTSRKQKNVLVTARPAILDEEGHDGLGPLVCVDPQAERKLRIARLLEHPLSDDVRRQLLRAIVSGYRHAAAWEANDIRIESFELALPFLCGGDTGAFGVDACEHDEPFIR